MPGSMRDKFKAILIPKPPSHAGSAQTSVTTPSTSPDELDLEADGNHTGKASEEAARKPEQKNHILEQRLHKAERKYAVLKKEIMEIDRVLRNEDSEGGDNKEEERTVLSMVLSLKKRNDTLTRELEACQGKLDSSIVDLRKAQLSSFKQSQTGWFVEEDSKIHETLAQLYKDVRRWAKTYCVKSLENFRELNTESRHQVNNAVSKVAFFASWDDFCGFKHPFLILAALVSEILSNSIFNNYFYIFNNPGEAHGDGRVGKILSDLFSRLGKSNNVEAHTWRALLFRRIFPYPEDPGLKIGAEFPNAGIQILYDHIMGEVQHGPAHLFVQRMEKKEQEKFISELRDLVIRALRLFSRLQTQRADYFWHSPSELLCTGFDVHCPDLTVDRLVKLEDDEDESHNGKRIKLVVSPMVQKHGDSNGENFETTSIITKAVVFLEG